MPFSPEREKQHSKALVMYVWFWGFFKVGHNNAIFISALCIRNQSFLTDHAEIQGELPLLSQPADLLFFRIQLVVFPTESLSFLTDPFSM